MPTPRNARSTCAAVLSSALASGCASTPSLPEPVWPTLTEQALLSEDSVFGDTEQTTISAKLKILDVDEAMRAFVAAVPRDTRDSDLSKMERLLLAMRQERLFEIDYAANHTLTAAQTFHARSGNCLSFTNLVIALARELGLDARYQLVDVPQMSERSADLVLVYGHINALVLTRRSGRYEVDFNADYGRTAFRRRPIDDRHATALFLNNLAAEALGQDNPSRAFSLLRQAIRTSEQAVAPWTNLGVMYRRAGKPQAAESAYRSALRRDPRDQTARHNLLLLYDDSNRFHAADTLRAQLQREQEKNPYFHHARGMQHLEQQQWREAGLAFLEAIKLNAQEAQFFASLAQAQRGMGDTKAARANLSEAIRLSANPAQTREWKATLQELSSS